MLENIIMTNEEIENTSKLYHENKEIEFQIIKTNKDQWDSNLIYNLEVNEESAANIANFLFNINNSGIEELVKMSLIKIGVKNKEFLSQILDYYEAIKGNQKKSKPSMKPSQTFRQN